MRVAPPSLPLSLSLARARSRPGRLARRFDINWMREAEIKHGRICMLAISGWLAVDAGLRFPGEHFAGISNSLEAHDAAVKSGDMWALLFIIGFCEALHMSIVVPKLDGDWGDYEPGASACFVVCMRAG